MLQVDVRESQAIKLLTDKNIPHETVALDAGDFRFIIDDKPLAIIERKTVADLAASIQDGRWRDQKKRLLDNYPRKHIYYIVEGNIFAGNTTFNNMNAVRGGIINTLFRDDIKVILLQDVVQTVFWLEEIHKRMEKNTDAFLLEQNAVCSMPQQHRKQSYSSKESAFVGMLCQIPGVSIAKATVLANKYDTMGNLVLNLNEDELAGLKTQSGRKFGNVLAKAIIQYLS